MTLHHFQEALELVKEHLMGVMGPSHMGQFSNVTVKMSKFQMAQVYAASIMFGYFLRRVDKRFQLERSLGTLTEDREDAVQRLEKLFSMADEGEEGQSSSTPTSSPTSSGSSNLPVKKEKSALRRYVEVRVFLDYDESTTTVALLKNILLEYHRVSARQQWSKRRGSSVQRGLP